jgi:hypothetical protein
MLVGCSGKKEGGSGAKKDAGQSEKKDEPKNLGRGISVKTLHADYEDNAVAAEKRYAGKPIEIWGEVLRVNVEIGKVSFVGSTPPLTGVECLFDKKYEDLLATIRKGQTVSFRGTIAGRQFGLILLDGCEPIDPPSPEKKPKPPTSKEDSARVKAKNLERALLAYYKVNDAYPDPKKLSVLTEKTDNGCPLPQGGGSVRSLGQTIQGGPGRRDLQRRGQAGCLHHNAGWEGLRQLQAPVKMKCF